MALMTFPDRQTVLDFLRENPSATTKQEIARGLKLKGKEADRPPPTGVVEFTHLDDDGELIGKSVGDNGLFGPEIRYVGPSGKPKAKAPAVGDRALCKISERDGEWLARAITVFEKRLSDKLVGLYSQTQRGGKVVPSSRKEKREFVIQEARRPTAIRPGLRYRHRSHRTHNRSALGQPAGHPRARHSNGVSGGRAGTGARPETGRCGTRRPDRGSTDYHRPPRRPGSCA